MLRNVYRAGNHEDLYRAKAVLRQHGIVATVIGDPDRNRGPKVGFFVELAVEESQAAEARKVLAEDAASRERDVSHLTRHIRRGLVRLVVVSALITAIAMIVAPELTMSILPGMFLGSLFLLVLLNSLRSAGESRRHERLMAGRCAECGYRLRGNRSGKCPECGTPVPTWHRKRQSRSVRSNRH